MLSQKIIIANWKMQLSFSEAVNLAQELKIKFKNYKFKNSDLILCSDFLAITRLSKILQDTKIALGSQDVFWEERGAYTGEISINDLKKFNTKFIIIGHSERRKYLLESNEMINKKIKITLKNKLTPILCIGETLNQRRDGQKDIVLIQQIKSALDGIQIQDLESLIIAYEPIWSISTNNVKQEIEIAEIEYTNKLIKQITMDTFNTSINNIENKIRFIFGGSVNQLNINNLMRQKHVQGVLIGKNSLNANNFINLINNAL